MAGMKAQKAAPVKAGRGFGDIHERMKGPSLPNGSRTGSPQAENLPPGFGSKSAAKKSKAPKRGK